MIANHSESNRCSMNTIIELASYYNSQVHAGFPSPAMDYMEERIDLNKILIKHPLSTFIIECTGDSMINAFIPPHAKLVI